MGQLAEALRDLEEETVIELVETGIKNGQSALEIISECNAGMVAVGELFSQNQYFLSELIYSGEILAGVMAKLEPLLQETGATESKGKVLVGTVKGDIHDIGKNIVISLLRGSGFEVIDMGVDVPTEEFAKKVKETGAKALGLCALLNFTYPEMKTVIETLQATGIRNDVQVIIGGAPCNEQVREYAGADYYAPDALAAVNLCKKIYQ
ncbi:cobalamin B12-binding domain-containing protein [Sporomusa sp.]|uniref:cobalamin B12-binding domain-containing protein n=1 Tax=Sporomusa sp. TaxID=2078658 RepID=UPI002C999066|nr:cobalamin-dependent protein [Sporomusa sp.]HWR06490.1 cobalamin-dependent protein [Sporomusa sp.]